MFKHAYVRGIQTALVNSGHAAFPDETTATKIADYIADHVNIDPLVGVAREATFKIASDVIEASDWIKTQPGFKAAAFNKLSSWDEVNQLADRSAVQLMTKAAEGSTIEGGDKGNAENQSPVGETKMDVKQRPPGYAEDSRGNSDVDTKPGTVGHESPHSNKPSESPSGSNSVIEHSRTASLADMFRKSAEGSTILGGDKGNMDMSSAEAKMDAHQRPVGYAVLPHQGALGAMMAQVTGPAVIGRETAHPNGPMESPSGSNSLIEHSAKAAAEDPYITLFKKVASEVHEYLPGNLNENAKIAAVRACMGLTTEEKAYYLRGLQKNAAATTPARAGSYDGRNSNQGRKQANDLPPFMKKEEKDDDKKDDGKDDKKDGKGGLPAFIQDKIDARERAEDGKDSKDESSKDEKKEASLQDYFRRIEAAQRA